MKTYGEESWHEEQQIFDQKLLIVEIPKNLIDVYAHKLETIRSKHVRGRKIKSARSV